LDDSKRTQIDVNTTVDQVSGRKAAWADFRRPNHVPADEWLGAESHVPNLGRELRQRNKPIRDMSVVWVAGALFMAGLAIGGLASVLLTRSGRIR